MITSPLTRLKRQTITRRTKKGRKPELLLSLLITLLVCSLIFFVWARLQITYLGYQISQANSEHTKLFKLNKQMKLEVASLKSLSRIENIAKNQLGLVNPESSQMVFKK